MLAVLVCAELNFFNFNFEYLRESEFLRKIILAYLSWARMGSIHENNWGKKSHDTASLKNQRKLYDAILSLFKRNLSSLSYFYFLKKLQAGKL